MRTRSSTPPARPAGAAGLLRRRTGARRRSYPDVRQRPAELRVVPHVKAAQEKRRPNDEKRRELTLLQPRVRSESLARPPARRRKLASAGAGSGTSSQLGSSPSSLRRTSEDASCLQGSQEGCQRGHCGGLDTAPAEEEVRSRCQSAATIVTQWWME